MKLSEAMRLGSMLGPQLYGRLVDGEGGSCAMGAACLATDLIRNERCASVKYREALRKWPSLETDTKCPLCGYLFRTWAAGVWAAVVHLNNDHRWTREAIADWVETIENAQVEKEAEYGDVESR